MKAGALIPARKGSKGLKDKNFRSFCGKPLFMWSVDAAVESGVFDKIVASSDGGFPDWFDTEYESLYVDNNRPEQFATDEAQLDGLMIHYAKIFPEIELWCLLQPTSPLRTAKDIERAYRVVCKDEWDSLVGVSRGTCMYWVDGAVGVDTQDGVKKMPVATYHVNKRPNRQDRKGWYRENGAIYFTKSYVLDSLGCRLGGDIALFKMPKRRSFEVDDELDWIICDALMRDEIARGRHGKA